MERRRKKHISGLLTEDAYAPFARMEAALCLEDNFIDLHVLRLSAFYGPNGWLSTSCVCWRYVLSRYKCTTDMHRQSKNTIDGVVPAGLNNDTGKTRNMKDCSVVFKCERLVL
ncbi:hypothetical protein RN001_015817 [Aquatica leii]|uniref:Uncharacterized protein n=1 Tax=Aquatica leii TaxID=1421715 RepID=A0AAN7SK37_9COLE|nr:hypothetical protein RN001_015817 [Aquatica leii]